MAGRVPGSPLVTQRVGRGTSLTSRAVQAAIHPAALRHNRAVDEVSADDLELAQRLYAEWEGGKPRSRIERETWGDGSSHGRRFDRFIHVTLGVSTRRRSKQSERIDDLERQIRGLGRHPAGRAPLNWERQLQHGREACLAALRTWNDPASVFRTGSFAVLFVVAWNSLAIAVIERAGGEWRDHDVAHEDYSRHVMDLVGEAFGGDDHVGLRENVLFWVDLRNAVAHRQLPALDALVIPEAQAGLLNFERTLVTSFGEEYALGERLCPTPALGLPRSRCPQVHALAASFAAPGRKKPAQSGGDVEPGASLGSNVPAASRVRAGGSRLRPKPGRRRVFRQARRRTD